MASTITLQLNDAKEGKAKQGITEVWAGWDDQLTDGENIENYIVQHVKQLYFSARDRALIEAQTDDF